MLATQGNLKEGSAGIVLNAWLLCVEHSLSSAGHHLQLFS